MIQGACVYRNITDYPVLNMYKEIDNGYILNVIYSNRKAEISYTKSKQFISLFPKHSMHITYNLPELNDDINITINNWINYISKLYIL